MLTDSNYFVLSSASNPSLERFEIRMRTSATGYAHNLVQALVQVLAISGVALRVIPSERCMCANAVYKLKGAEFSFSVWPYTLVPCLDWQIL
jgi:hypothetical protein